MNILLCDDDPDEMATLMEILTNLDSQVEVNCFECSIEALEFVKSGAKVDLCCLDIIMPDMTGIQLAKELRDCGYSGEIVFLSSSNEYGPESYTVNAFSYLLKPPSTKKIQDVLGQVQQRQHSADSAELSVHVAGRVMVIPHRFISYIEVVRHTVHIHMVDGGAVRVNTTFSAIAAKVLDDSRFIRCHRSYIVNMQDIAEISKRELVVRSGVRIPIPRTYGDTQARFYRWKFGSVHQ